MCNLYSITTNQEAIRALFRPFAVEQPRQCGSPLPDELGLDGAAAFGAVKQENGEQSQELSAGSILYCSLLELRSVVARRAHRDATPGSFFLECNAFL